jgi:nicotinate-nucleotide pyrophosphorylase (carboxylating)
MLDSKINRLVEEALLEDVGFGDITTEAIVPAGATGRAEILVKQQGVLSGLEIAWLVFHQIDPEITFEPRAEDGLTIDAGTVAAYVAGSLSSILRGERTALNFLQRMSGIATMTAGFVAAVRHTHAEITDTRKTAPGLRAIDKLAVRTGGGVNHRFGLDDMVLIKDNHIAAAGGIIPAIDQCRKYLRACGLSVNVEVETSSIDDVRKVLARGGVDRIMLDNFTIPMMDEAVRLIGGKIEVEASGNVSMETVRAIAETGVDFISIGALTHSPKALDIALDVIPSPVA